MARLLFGLMTALVATTAIDAAPASAQSYVSQIVASNLRSPRGLTVAADGSIYIAESGVPASGVSTTGGITRVRNGVQERIVTGLPSLTGPMGEATGPQDIAFGSDGFGYVLVGFGADPLARSTTLGGGAANGLGSLVRFSDNGTYTSIADVSAYERLYNPLGGAYDSNPFHMVAGGAGFLVTDAGSNTLLNVSTSGSVERLASFPGHQVGPNPAADSVPTGIAVGPGGYYVAELTGAPFTAGAANIYRLGMDGALLQTFGGFTDITDIAFAPDGSLYVLEYDADGIIGGSNLGALLRIAPDGTRQTIFSDGLIRPTGLAIGGNGDIFVSVFSTAGDSGQVLQISAVPEAATWAMLLVGFGLVGTMLRRSQVGRRQPVQCFNGIATSAS